MMTPAQAPKRIAVAGNPNSGKTSVFNALTGLRHKIANYPGVTVEKREGRMQGADVVLVDLPGSYALSARSSDEAIAQDVLLGRLREMTPVNGVLLVVDATNLERNLYLASQVLDLGMPMVIACNMMDVAAKSGVTVNCEVLARELGVPVVGTVANRGRGIEALRAALADMDGRPAPAMKWRLSAGLEAAVVRVARALAQSEATGGPAAEGKCGAAGGRSGAGVGLLWLCEYLSGEEACRRSADRLLARLPEQRARECRAAAAAATAEPDAVSAVIEVRYAWITEVVGRVRSFDLVGIGATQRASRPSDRIDAALTHRVWGLAAFAGIVFIMFLAVFWGAEPLMKMIEIGRQAAERWIGALFAEGPLRSLMADGIVAGAGAVVVFLPQVWLLFLCLAVLEDTGYMARAAFIMDPVMGRVGLPGKSFIPLVSCHACAVPGILAARTVENPRDRLTTMLVAPLVSCSARLPVYLLLAGAVLGQRTWLKALVMFGLYALGTATALVMARILRKTILAGPKSTFIMELPPLHVPRLLPILRATWDRSRLFLTNAGTIIFAASILVWALGYFPRPSVDDLPTEARTRLTAIGGDRAQGRKDLIASERLRHSYLGRLGRAIEPAIRPLGYDWRLGVGVLSSFLAREAFVGTMGITFAISEGETHPAQLREQLAGAKWPDGRPVLTPLVGVGLMVFYVLACQCVSTLATVRKETRSWRWPAFLFGYTTALAYVAALLIYQVGRALGLG
jgi:ferrous iron transport protein B